MLSKFRVHLSICKCAITKSVNLVEWYTLSYSVNMCIFLGLGFGILQCINNMVFKQIIHCIQELFSVHFSEVYSSSKHTRLCKHLAHFHKLLGVYVTGENWSPKFVFTYFIYIIYLHN